MCLGLRVALGTDSKPGSYYGDYSNSLYVVEVQFQDATTGAPTDSATVIIPHNTLFNINGNYDRSGNKYLGRNYDFGYGDEDIFTIGLHRESFSGIGASALYTWSVLVAFRSTHNTQLRHAEVYRML